ncbi:MAG: hypothetical protein GY842_02075 [bacterium]|nr:hypothetical protein [bacterium]
MTPDRGSTESLLAGKMYCHRHSYLAELRAVEPRGPYQLAGWSFGGLVAYEMACRLQNEA